MHQFRAFIDKLAGELHDVGPPTGEVDPGQSRLSAA